MTTGEVARELGISEPYLQDLIRRRKVVAPKIVRGRRVWTRADIEAARRAISNSK